MIPDGFYEIETAEPAILTSRTYYIDPKTKRIVGMVDGAQAASQAAQKAVQTERFSYEIYDDSYGAEYERLIGQDMAYVRGVLKKITEEALLNDERFLSIANFEIVATKGNEINFRCDVETTYGAIDVNRS